MCQAWHSNTCLLQDRTHELQVSLSLENKFFMSARVGFAWYKRTIGRGLWMSRNSKKIKFEREGVVVITHVSAVHHFKQVVNIWQHACVKSQSVQPCLPLIIYVAYMYYHTHMPPSCHLYQIGSPSHLSYNEHATVMPGECINAVLFINLLTYCL